MTENSTDSDGDAEEAATGAEVEIAWWGWAPELQVADQFIAAFNEVHPEIAVNYRQIPIADYDAAIRPALSSDAGPDVFGIAPGGGIGSIALLGQFAEDLGPVAEEALGEDWESQLAPIGPPGMTMEDGKLAGLPIGSTYAGTIWINQDLFDENGLEPPTTLTEWLEVCDAFEAAGVGCFAQGAGQVAFNQDTLQAIANTVEPGVWTRASRGEASWDDPAIVEALEIWKRMFEEGIMQDGAIGAQHYPDVHNAFMGGEYAMVMMGTWYMQYATEAGIDPAVTASGVSGAESFTAMPILFPDVAEAGHERGLFGDPDWGLAVNAESSQADAARTFAAWFTTTTEGQQTVANSLFAVASLIGVSPEWDEVTLVDEERQRPVIEDIVGVADATSEPRLSLMSAEDQEAVGVASTTVASGRATPQEAAATLQASIGE